MRVSDEHTCPVITHSAPASVAAAVAMSASSRITAADFPPSSSVQRAMRSPQIAPILRPAAVEPVNVILSIRGSRTSSSDTSRSAVTHVEHAGREPDLLRGLGDEVALAGRLGRQLEHDRAAGEQRGADLVGDQAERAVPRDDRADRADRLAHEQAEAGHRRLRGLLQRERVGRARRTARTTLRRPSRRAGRSCGWCPISRGHDSATASARSMIASPNARRYSAALGVGQARPRSLVERGARRGRPRATCRRPGPRRRGRTAPRCRSR